MEQSLEPIAETKIEEDTSLVDVSLDDKPSENNTDLIDNTDNTTETISYDELNKKHKNSVQKNLKMSTDLINFRMKIEELENNNSSI
ncbi:32776_t:CDS:1, partial [Racocetra persica]